MCAEMVWRVEILRSSEASSVAAAFMRCGSSKEVDSSPNTPAPTSVRASVKPDSIWVRADSAALSVTRGAMAPIFSLLT